MDGLRAVIAWYHHEEWRQYQRCRVMLRYNGETTTIKGEVGRTMEEVTREAEHLLGLKESLCLSIANVEEAIQAHRQQGEIYLY